MVDGVHGSKDHAQRNAVVVIVCLKDIVATLNHNTVESHVQEKLLEKNHAIHIAAQFTGYGENGSAHHVLETSMATVSNTAIVHVFHQNVEEMNVLENQEDSRNVHLTNVQHLAQLQQQLLQLHKKHLVHVIIVYRKQNIMQMIMVDQTLLDMPVVPTENTAKDSMVVYTINIHQTNGFSWYVQLMVLGVNHVQQGT